MPGPTAEKKAGEENGEGEAFEGIHPQMIPLLLKGIECVFGVCLLQGFRNLSHDFRGSSDLFIDLL